MPHKDWQQRSSRGTIALAFIGLFSASTGKGIQVKALLHAPRCSQVRHSGLRLWHHGGVQMGAMMNEAFQAKEGLPPDLFPDRVPTYTGHYHKPHVVENTNIQYVGSPYQGCDQSVKLSFDMRIS